MHRFQMTYEHCGQTWIETWSSACNDKCPVCNKEIEPSEIEDVRSYATDGDSDGV